MPTIEVDSEVFEYLRSKVRDFNESPNSVLRRELRIEALAPRPGRPVRSEARSASSATVSDLGLPLGAPEALRQIIEVALLVRRDKLDRVSATVRVAERHRVTRETVGDKYGRQLELTTREFDELLAESSLNGLRNLLSAKFPRYRSELSEVLNSIAR
jgi:hypothetical protein